jgi:hypothetical protein
MTLSDRSQKPPEMPQGEERGQPPPTGGSDSSRVVVFADMLGFAALTEANPINVRMLQSHSRPLSRDVDWPSVTEKSKNPLTEAFSMFHHHLKWAIMMAEMRHAITAITFSDSVFVATNDLCEAATFAADLAFGMLSGGVPVRMGLGFGSFAALRFRSDVSADGGDHAAQFLGTSVVRAYQAERCGIKGMRVLIHPSVETLLSSKAGAFHSTRPGSRQLSLLEVPDTEHGNAAHVRYELNYWNMATTKERDAWHKLQDMWDAAPESAKMHYQASAEAINRMRMANGEPAVTALRRRTLPRRRT